MNIREANAKTILRKRKKIDSWFISHYGMNLYRGCVHNCVYCDGRSEKYRVEGEFGRDVEVKINAPVILNRELDPNRKRIPMKKSFLMIGGGVGDGYQEVEKKYRLTGKALDLAFRYQYPVHVLTKSTAVLRDIDILKKINSQNRAIVSFSFSSVDDKIGALFEPGVPPPSERLKTISFLKKQGIPCGMFLMPVIPFITDTREQISASVAQGVEAGADFVIFSTMTLKDGKQKEYFITKLERHYPGLLGKYRQIYRKNKWGGTIPEYFETKNRLFLNIANKYKIPKRIPPRLFTDVVDENDRVILFLEHLDYFLKSTGRPSPYGFAAYSISQLGVPLSEVKNDLKKIKGVGKVMERIILEILDSRKSTYYDKLA